MESLYEAILLFIIPGTAGNPATVVFNIEGAMSITITWWMLCIVLVLAPFIVNYFEEKTIGDYGLPLFSMLSFTGCWIAAVVIMIYELL